MADKPEVSEAAKRELEDGKKLKEQIRAEHEKRAKWKPTPTQEENDLAACGVHVLEKEEDGSGPDPNLSHTKHMEAATPAPYRTRETRATASRSE